jgi:hypothetical protein
VPEVDRTGEAGEQPAAPGPSNAEEVPHVAPVSSRRIPRRWLPWAAAIGVAVIALAVALPLTLGGSSTITTPTPTTSSGELTGTYLTTSIQDARLVFVSLTQSGSELAGTLTVTTSGPARKHVVVHRYTVSGTVSGPALHLTLTPIARAAPYTLNATYSSGTITATFGTGSPLTLQRGSLAKYRLLVKQEHSALLS